MLSRIRLQNFRRYLDTEINFDDDHRLVVISGPNGAGKTSLLEGICFGLYGEPRSGRAGRRRSNLDQLIRRGAEFEGMQVELDFTVAGVDYQVIRRRDNKISSAILYGNSNPIVEGPDLVTSEITRILGMDSAGFRLAVVAEQSQLDGLASKGPKDRAIMLSRLLRLDVVTAAHAKARESYINERNILAALGPGEGLGQLQLNLDTALASEHLAITARDDSRASLAILDQTLATSLPLERSYQQALTDTTAAQATLLSAEKETERLHQELDQLQLPKQPSAPSLSADQLVDETRDLELRIGRAEAAKDLSSQRSVIEGELARTETRLATLEQEYAVALEIAKHQDSLITQLASATAAHAAAGDELERTRNLKAQAEATANLASKRLASLSHLGAVCDLCGQKVTEAHRRSELATATEQAAQSESDLATATQQLITATSTLETALSLKESLAEQSNQANSNAHTLIRLNEEQIDLLRRRDTYLNQLTSPLPSPVDIEHLYAERARYSILAVELREYEEASRRRTELLERRSAASDSLRAAEQRSKLANAALTATRPTPELESAHELYHTTLKSREQEADLLKDLELQLAVSTNTTKTARRDLDRAGENAANRRSHETAGVVAANAARILDAASVKLATTIRPALEGACSTLLSQLSDGRFDAVQIDEDYSVTVKDDGDFRPLSEFSGGEMDLVALSIRLALSEVVGSRHGAGALGLLVLDECFGSQDKQRRESIRSTLHNLRLLRGQIFLISHVEGLEDIADLEIEVSPDFDEDGNRIATVTLI